MMERACSAPVFFLLFGLMFLYFGGQRLLKLSTEENKREALVWGSVGIFLAAGFLWMAAWFFRGDPAETDRQLEGIRARRQHP